MTRRTIICTRSSNMASLRPQAHDFAQVHFHPMWPRHWPSAAIAAAGAELEGGFIDVPAEPHADHAFRRGRQVSRVQVDHHFGLAKVDAAMKFDELELALARRGQEILVEVPVRIPD